MKKLLLLLALSPLARMQAQIVFPEFSVAEFEIKIPTNLPGLKEDKEANGFITYTLKGQVFTSGQNNTIQEAGFDGKTDKATPYQTLTELVAVVRKNDWKGLKALYDKPSTKELDDLVPPDKRADYFNALNQNKEVKLIAGFEYRDGFMVLIENPDQSVNTAFFIKEKKQYKLHRLVDTSAMLWNIAVYFRFKPQPPQTANLVQQLDSLPANSEQKLVFTVQKPGNWILLYKAQDNSPVIVRVQDGDPDLDFDPAPGKVEIHLGRSQLSGPKMYEILATETNYPIYMVNGNLMANARKIVFKVY